MILRAKSRARRAFTLVELMVVIAIIGLLATVVTVNVIGQMEGANTAKVKADFKAIKDAMKLFKVHLGYWPQSIQDLMQAPGDAGNRWKGPYLDEQPRDPWQREYRVEPGSPPKIVTLGADGNQGGEGEARDLDSDTINQAQE